MFPLVAIIATRNGTNALGDLISQGYVFAQGIVALCAFFMFIYAGLKIMIGAPATAKKRRSEAKQIIIDVVIGLVLLFSAYIILNTINHSLVAQAPSGGLLQ